MSTSVTSPGANDARAQLRDAPSRFRVRRPLPASPGAPAGRPASVLILFGPRQGATGGPPRASGLSVLLQVRATTLREHAGQVSFPGGRAEARDVDPVHTALREAQEETGLDPASVEVLAVLDPVPLAVSDHHVTPVVGWWASPVPLTAVDRAETTRVWQVPVSQLLDPSSRFTSVLRRGDHRLRGPAFDVDGTVVWGFTAMVLDALFDAAGWTLSWDAARERPISG